MYGQEHLPPIITAEVGVIKFTKPEADCKRW